MNPLAAYPFAHALGWTLLHFCWQGAAVALLLACVLGAVGPRYSRTRYTAACASLALLVALPLITFVRFALQDYHLATLARVPLQTADIFINAGSGQTVEPWTVRISAMLDHAMPWMLAAWCVGVACFLARLSLGLVAARGLRKSGAAVPTELQLLFLHLHERLRISRAVQLLLSARVEVPTVIGWLRPVVLLPASCLSGLAPVQIEAILCHELAHIRRHDYLVSVLQSVVETLLFYHPAVWWISTQLRRERECCCDEFAAHAGGDVLAYARALALLEEQRTPTPQFALAANGGVLKMRMQRLLGRPEASIATQFASIAVLVLLAISGLTVAGRMARAESRDTQPTVSNAPPAGYAPIPLAQVQDASAASTDAATQTRQLRADIERIAALQNDAAGLRAQADALNRQEASYNALLAQANQQPQLSEEDRRRLEDAAQSLTQTIDQWTDLLRADIDARAAAMARFQSPEFQRQLTDAMTRVNSPEFRKQLADAQAAVAKLNTADMRRQMEAAQAEMKRLNAEDLQKQMEAAKAAMAKVDMDKVRRQMDAAQAAMEKMNTPELRRQMDESAKAVARLNTPEFRRQIEDAAKAAQLAGHAGVFIPVEPTGSQPQLFARGAAPAMEVPPPDDASAQPAQSAQPTPGGSQRVSAGVMQGLVISQPPPVYPPEAKAAHVQGVVVLHAIISKEGTVQDLKVISGPPMLIKSAIDAVQHWTYRPYLLNGEPVEVETTINVNYTFGGDSRPGQPAEPGAGAPPPPPPPGSASFSDVPPAADEAGNAVRRIGGAVTAPLMIYQDEPEFTEEARAAKASGRVLVGLIVDEAGLPEDVHSVHSEFVAKKVDSNLSSITAGMNAKAVEAVQRYRFKPAMENGQPVSVSLNVEVNFQVF